MKNHASILFFAALFSLFATSCIQEFEDEYEFNDYQTEAESYYKEYQDEDFLSDEDSISAVWDVKFSFLGAINSGERSKEEIKYGSGFLTYLNLENSVVTVNYATWAIKKMITMSSGEKVPMVQVFFADAPENADEEGRIIYFVLQLEGASIAKSETRYLNNDKIYKTKATLDETGEISEICYIQEPVPSQGRVTIYTHNIRIDEELKVEGYANMLDMEMVECKKMN